MTEIKKVMQKEINSDLLWAVRNNDFYGIKEALKFGADPNIKDIDNNGVAALHIVSAKGYSDIAELLIQAGADINIRDKYGNAPIAYGVTADWGKGEIVNTLIEAGAELNIQNKSGWTPLMHAAYYKNINVMDMLIEAGAEVNIKKNNGQTVFDILKEKLPEKYNLWIRQHTLKREDMIETGNFYSEPDFNI